MAAVRTKIKICIIFTLLICAFYSNKPALACDDENKGQSPTSAQRVFSPLQTLQWRPSAYFQSLDAQRAATAIMSGTVDPLKKLHAEGFDWNTQGREGITLLLWAFLADEFEVFCQLLEWGADPDSPLTFNEKHRLIRGVRPFVAGDSVTLILAVVPNKDRWLFAAITHGGDPNAEDISTGDSVFTTALSHGKGIGQNRLSVIDLMIEKGANIHYRSRIGEGALLKSFFANEFDIVNKFLTLGVSPHCYDRQDWLLVHHVAAMEEERRLDNEQFPAKKQEWLESPLRKDFERLVELLAERGFPLEDAIADLKRRNETINGVPYMKWRRMQREDKDACTEQPAQKAAVPGAKDR